MDLLTQLRGMRERLTASLANHADAAVLESRYESLIEEAVALIADTPDDDLLRAYQRTLGEPGDPEADALLAEIERRGLDV